MDSPRTLLHLECLLAFALWVFAFLVIVRGM